MRACAMLDEIDALPGAERHLAVHDRNAETDAREHRLDMARHVVGALFLMGVVRAFGRKRLECVAEIAPHIRVGILLDRQRGRGMAHEHGEEPVAAADIVEPTRGAPR